MKKIYRKALSFAQIIGKSIVFSAALILTGCDDFVKIDPPRTDLIKSTVFDSDATANAAMTNIYYEMRSNGFASGSTSSISFWATYSSDEQINYTISSFQQFNDNELIPDNSFILALWSQMYKTIYNANAVIEGIAESQNVSAPLKMQLEGEAKFIRAFCHFYLVNLFGDVPVVTTTDYRANSDTPRTPIHQVYQLIISDLQDAQGLLPEDYGFANNERVRVNKFAATALLSRTYLYTEKWTNAETEATAVISNAGLYSLKSNLSDIFLTNSTEAILQWWSNFRPNDRGTFRVLIDPPFYGALRSEFATSFEVGDLRNTTWVSLTAGHYNARKYTAIQDNPPLEYSTVLRLAEQYLIRAEARAQQDNISDAQMDVNVIRNRAGLSDTPANDKASLLLAIEQERKSELFTEWGHRWFDLKRTNRADAILAPIKGSNWDATDVLYPIPEAQLLNDPAMNNAQNPGY